MVTSPLLTLYSKRCLGILVPSSWWQSQEPCVSRSCEQRSSFKVPSNPWAQRDKPVSAPSLEPHQHCWERGEAMWCPAQRFHSIKPHPACPALQEAPQRPHNSELCSLAAPNIPNLSGGLCKPEVPSAGGKTSGGRNTRRRTRQLPIKTPNCRVPTEKFWWWIGFCGFWGKNYAGLKPVGIL